MTSYNVWSLRVSFTQYQRQYYYTKFGTIFVDEKAKQTKLEKSKKAVYPRKMNSSRRETQTKISNWPLKLSNSNSPAHSNFEF